MFLHWLHCKPGSAPVLLYYYSVLSERMTKVLSLVCKYSIIRPVLKIVFPWLPLLLVPYSLPMFFPCFFSNCPLHHLGSSAALLQFPCVPSRTLLLCSLNMLPLSWHFPMHKIIVEVLCDSYSSSFNIFCIRTAAPVLFDIFPLSPSA